MHFLAAVWRRIGARLYLTLGAAVLLTLVSSAVGVYYFEQSGDASFQVQEKSVPALEASWAAARQGERLRSLAAAAAAGPVAPQQVDQTLQSLEEQLSAVTVVPALGQRAESVQEPAYRLATIIDNLAIGRQSADDAAEESLQLRERSAGAGAAAELESMRTAADGAELDRRWDEFSSLGSLDAETVELGQQIFEVRARQLAVDQRATELATEAEDAGAALETALSVLLKEAGTGSADALEASVAQFDQGRILLAGISLVSVGVATAAAWLLVGNGLVRPLTRLSERMRGMADGDLETPVPGLGRDEIGDLAHALEVFRAQALEVQRLNLVEKLYSELQQANDELKRMQNRLVAQEKLAALGELVSGVAHEISNPLNFVQNFAEISVEMYEELSEVLATYEDSMSDADRTSIQELKGDLSDSLGRIRTNGGRALAIVERMRGLGVVGGDLVQVSLNPTLRGAVEVATEAFLAQWKELRLNVEYDLDDAVGEVSLVEHDFGEAVVNLVSNACYAMWLRQSEGDDPDYRPRLQIASAAAGDSIEVRVRDNGTGIADDVVGHIFNPFFSTRDGALGAGLGLSIAADVIHRAGGAVSVETVPGQFAEFTISLPAAAPVPAG